MHPWVEFWKFIDKEWNILASMSSLSIAIFEGLGLLQGFSLGESWKWKVHRLTVKSVTSVFVWTAANGARLTANNP